MPVGMSAIFTSIVPPTPDQLAALAKANEQKAYGSYRCTLGRRAVAELVATVAPRERAALAKTILDRDLWGFLTPAASRGNHIVALQSANPDLQVPTPLWPPSVELACLVGAPPAHYIGNNLVMLPADLVPQAVAAFAVHEDACEPAAYLNEFLRGVEHRGDALLLHWDYR